MARRRVEDHNIRERVDSKGRTRYEVRYRRADGTRPSRTFASLRDARAFADKVFRAKLTDTLESIDAGNMTVEKLAEEWWDARASRLARATQNGYLVLLERHILPEIGNETIARLQASPKLVFDFQTRLSSRVGVDTVRKSMFVLQGIFRYAVECGYASGNPVQLIKKPRLRPRRPARALSLEAVEWMRAVAIERGDVFDAALISVLAYAGLRPGEAQTLTWDDVSGHVISVYTGNDDGREKSTKTLANRTTRYFSPLSVDLAALKEVAQPRKGDEYLFAREDGGVFRVDDWNNWRNRRFRSLALTAGARGMRPYDLRHVFVSLLIAEGKSIAYIARQAGHSQEMTLRTYSHVFDEFEDGQTIDATAEILRWRGIVEAKRTGREPPPDA